MDDETSLVYMKARFYDPDSARFLTEDSYLGQQDLPPSLNRYLYSYSNPLKYIDPTGHEACVGEKLKDCSDENHVPDDKAVPQELISDDALDPGLLNQPIFTEDAEPYVPNNTKIAPYDEHIFSEKYHYVPHYLISEDSESHEVAYYDAYNQNTKNIEYKVPPTALDQMIANEEYYENWAKYDRGFGEKRGSAKKARDIYYEGAQGNLGKALKKFFESWEEGLTEPETYLDLGLSIPGGMLARNAKVTKGVSSPEINYAYFNKTHKDSLPRPKGRGPNDGRLQSHHELQQQWAKENLSDYGYDSSLAPSVTIETGAGHPHTTISRQQNIRRNARVESGQGKWSSSLQDELQYIVDDMTEAGFQRETIKQSLQQQYRMLDKLNVPYQKLNY